MYVSTVCIVAFVGVGRKTVQCQPLSVMNGLEGTRLAKWVVDDTFRAPRHVEIPCSAHSTAHRTRVATNS